jgi:hypothetical protein
MNNKKSLKKKQVGLKTNSQRVVEGGITTFMLKLNGSWRFRMNF